jgi:hypothetical protein
MLPIPPIAPAPSVSKNEEGAVCVGVKRSVPDSSRALLHEHSLPWLASSVPDDSTPIKQLAWLDASNHHTMNVRPIRRALIKAMERKKILKQEGPLRVLELGAGASTLFVRREMHGVVAPMRMEWVGVDTDANVARDINRRLREAGESDAVVVHACVGETGKFGRPKDASRWSAYAYHFLYMHAHGWIPDVVINDGRWRVASAAISMALWPRSVLVWDDYWNRKQYHVFHKAQHHLLITRPFPRLMQALVVRERPDCKEDTQALWDVWQHTKQEMD